ncbi:MAG TPA: hypothetical protein VM733_19675, partial [Thermoanaerobaculia bacterium]|nr:hypothetical protein [Thermoanaerobaculia bacterium]
MTTPAAGLWLGAVMGLIDCAVLVVNPYGERGELTVSAPLLAGVLWTWMTIGCATGALFSSQRLRRLRGAALMITGPGLLLLSRAVLPFRGWSGWRPSRVVLAWALVTLLFCAIGVLVRFAPAKHPWRWAVAAALSLTLMMLTAANLLHFRRASARPGASGRNVALIILDTARYDDTMTYAPHVAAFARNAIAFDNAWATGSWTVPSHFAMLTGRDPWTVPYDSDQKRYAYDGRWLG